MKRRVRLRVELCNMSCVILCELSELPEIEDAIKKYNIKFLGKSVVPWYAK